MKIATWLVSYKFNEDMPPVAGRLLLLTLQAVYFKKRLQADVNVRVTQ